MTHPTPMDPILVAEFADMLHERRSRIDEALARIRSGSFGICTECAGPIQFLHLWSDPTSERCLGCARQPRAAEQLRA
jgi:RNA polymerase-binding transcription factor DksA